MVSSPGAIIDESVAAAAPEPACEAVLREAEEDWGSCRRRGLLLVTDVTGFTTFLTYRSGFAHWLGRALRRGGKRRRTGADERG